VRYGIVADVHANLAAFEAVLNDMGHVDALWCLGDLVGYGPDPNECIELLRRQNHLCILGNHDMAAVGLLDTEEFNPHAAFAADWTAATLTERSRNYLLGLPDRLVAEPFTFVHGSPRSPAWEYITNEDRAAPNFQQFDTPACLVGHTHVPVLFTLEDSGVQGRVPGPGDRVEIGPHPVIANPGGVGQPRDGDPRAAYALYDSDTRILGWQRVDYPIQLTQQRMKQSGLPQRLIDRLTFGW
jgi:diadenosine tetraphosphatase ApaH/serine/threonine PP2A family protein phosphatase